MRLLSDFYIPCVNLAVSAPAAIGIYVAKFVAARSKVVAFYGYDHTVVCGGTFGRCADVREQYVVVKENC